MNHLPQLSGPNVCDYNRRLSYEPTRFGEDSNTTENTATHLTRNCCPGYEPSIDRRRCISNMDFLNPFKDSDNFSLAIISLAVFLLIVALLSMLIAYRYYYRFRIGRKSGILTEEPDFEAHEDAFVIGFTTTHPHFDDNPYKQQMIVR